MLLLGYGNPGRLDDGLGPALAAAVEGAAPAGVVVESDYQLVVEHAAAAAASEHVVFADAAVCGPEPFAFARVRPGSMVPFSTHGIGPEAVVAMARELFGRDPEAYTLAIRGYAFDGFGETLSRGARRNLEAALEFILPVLRQRSFRAVAAVGANEKAATNGEARCAKAGT